MENSRRLQEAARKGFQSNNCGENSQDTSRPLDFNPPCFSVSHLEVFSRFCLLKSYHAISKAAVHYAFEIQITVASVKSNESRQQSCPLQLEHGRILLRHQKTISTALNLTKGFSLSLNKTRKQVVLKIHEKDQGE